MPDPTRNWPGRKPLRPEQLANAIDRLVPEHYLLGTLTPVEHYEVEVLGASHQRYLVSISAYYTWKGKGAGVYYDAREITHLELACTCPGGSWGHACKHLALVLNEHLPEAYQLLTRGLLPATVLAYRDLPEEEQ